MKSIIVAGLAFLFAFGWTAVASAQSKGGDVSSGDTGPEAKKEETTRWTADERARGLHRRTKDNDDLYDAIANLGTPRRDRVLPWVVGLSLGGVVMFMGLKHSFRNRYEG